MIMTFKSFGVSAITGMNSNGSVNLTSPISPNFGGGEEMVSAAQTAASTGDNLGLSITAFIGLFFASAIIMDVLRNLSEEKNKG